MEWETIKVEDFKGGVWMLTLNRPEARNAISIKMRREISAALKKLEADKFVGALVITGAGTAFCAGFDLKEFGRPEIFDDLFESSSAYHRDLWHFPKPTIAAINGTAMGGGFDMAVLCDIRICSDNAKFGHPEIKFGGPPLFTPLCWITGFGAAKDLCLTGRKISAEEALRIGLVSEIAGSEKTVTDKAITDKIEKEKSENSKEEKTVATRAVEIARTILDAPAKTLTQAKKYMNDAPGRTFEQAFTAEHDDVFKDFAKNPK